MYTYQALAKRWVYVSKVVAKYFGYMQTDRQTDRQLLVKIDRQKDRHVKQAKSVSSILRRMSECVSVEILKPLFIFRKT